MAWAPGYCSTEELKGFLRIDDAVDDTELGFAVAAASRAIDHATNRQFGKTDATEARYYPPRWDWRASRWIVDIDDLASTSGLEIDVDVDGDLSYSGAVSDYQPLPLNAAAAGRPWTMLAVLPASPVQPTDPKSAQVRVTGAWGWSAVPDAIKHATLLQASRLVARRDAPFGVAGSPDVGSEVRLLAKLDPDVAVTVRSYRRVWGAA